MNFHNNRKLKVFKAKILTNEISNAAMNPKNYKDLVKLNYNYSYNISQPHYNINKSLEENKKVLSNNHSTSRLKFEKEKNLLLNNLKKQIKINNFNKKVIKVKVMNQNLFESNNNAKSKINVLTDRKNNKINQKRFSNNLKQVFQFIDEINPFVYPNNGTFENIKNLVNYKLINKDSLKNTILQQMFKKIDFPINKFSDEILNKYILKNTFKAVLKKGYLNNSLISKQEIKDEYYRQIDEAKRYLPFLNEENEGPYYDKDLGSLLINNSFNLSNSNDNKVILNKRCKIMNPIKHKRNRQIFENKSVDNIYSKFYSSNKELFDTKYKIIQNKNKEFTKNNYLSFHNNVNNEKNDFKLRTKNYSKNEIFKTYSKEKKLNDIILKPKNYIINQKNIVHSFNHKVNAPLNSENSKQETCKGFKIFLSKNTFKEKENRNEDIINFINNNENIKFSNRFREGKIINHNTNIIFEKRNFYNNSLNLEKGHTEQFERGLFKEKYNIDKNYFIEDNKEYKSKRNESTKDNHFQLFNKGNELNRKESEKNNNDKKILIKKICIKKKKALKERKFKDLLKEEVYENNTKTTNHKIEDKDLIEDKNLIEEDWQYRFNEFKKYVEKLKKMSNDEFTKDTLKFIKNYE